MDPGPILRTKEAKIVKIIEAIDGLRTSKEWSSLKTEVFDGLVVKLERDLREEAEKLDPSTNKLSRIAGELKWARRYANLDGFALQKRVELKNIRQQLHGKSES